MKKKLAQILFFLTGLASLVWMLVRVVPKPSRVEYPCMKVAAPLAGSFVAYVGGMALALFSVKKGAALFRNRRAIPALLLVLCGIVVGTFTLLRTDSESNAAILATDSLFVPGDAPNTPMGVARGIFPGRVVWAWDSTATTWNGITGNWWTDASTHQVVVDSMLTKSLRSISGKYAESAAWDTLFRYFNIRHGKGNVGSTRGEKIAIKINLVQTSGPGYVGNAVFVAPQLAVSLLRQLVTIAGVRDSDITIFDTDRYVPDPVYAKCKAAFPGVHYVGWVAANGRELYVRDTTTTVHWSQKLTMELTGGNTAYLPTVVTRASYIINLGQFKAHRYMGLTLCSKNHFGTLSVSDSTGTPQQGVPHYAGLHPYTAVHDITIPGSAEWTFKGRPMGTYNTLVDLMGHKDLGEKTLLFMIDALYAVEGEGNPVATTSRWQSQPFNGHWSSSLFMSLDNIAIESVGLDFLRTEQSVNPNYTLTYGAVDNYLHEGSQANNPPSGTYYSPSGDSVRLPSLGVHEHWNNAVEKKYTRNLGTGNGIELVQLKGNLVTGAGPAAQEPSGFALRQNYPNPFNPSTTVSFTIPGSRTVALIVYDVVGRHIRTLVNGTMGPGEHAARWDGRDDAGRTAASGVYFVTMKAGTDFAATRKMILAK